MKRSDFLKFFGLAPIGVYAVGEFIPARKTFTTHSSSKYEPFTHFNDGVDPDKIFELSVLFPSDMSFTNAKVGGVLAYVTFEYKHHLSDLRVFHVHLSQPIDNSDTLNWEII